MAAITLPSFQTTAFYEFLQIARGEKRRIEEEEKDKTKWNVSAREFSPARKKEETEKK